MAQQPQIKVHPAVEQALRKQNALVGTYAGLSSLLDDVGLQILQLNQVLHQKDEEIQLLKEELARLRASSQLDKKSDRKEK